MAEIEKEVLGDGQEWMRQRLVHGRKRQLTLRTQVGHLVIKTDYEQETQSGNWLCSQREIWGCGVHQKLTPLLADKLAFTLTATGSDEEEVSESASCNAKRTVRCPLRMGRMILK